MISYIRNYVYTKSKVERDTNLWMIEENTDDWIKIYSGKLIIKNKILLCCVYLMKIGMQRDCNRLTVTMPVCPQPLC